MRGAIVKNVILRNIVINLGFASVNNYIPQGDIFYYLPLGNIILMYYYPRKIVKNVALRPFI